MQLYLSVTEDLKAQYTLLVKLLDREFIFMPGQTDQVSFEGMLCLVVETKYHKSANILESTTKQLEDYFWTSFLFISMSVLHSSSKEG